MTAYHKAMIASLAVVAAALVAGWFRPVPGDVPPGTLPPENWTLPPVASLERSSAAMVSEATRVAWIGAAGGSGGMASGGASSWTLLGVVSDREQPAALVQAAGKPDVLRIRRGAALPDGTLLVAIERGAVVYERDGCRIRRPVHPVKQDEAAGPADACAATQDKQEDSTP